MHHVTLQLSRRLFFSAYDGALCDPGLLRFARNDGALISSAQFRMRCLKGSTT